MALCLIWVALWYFCLALYSISWFLCFNCYCLSCIWDSRFWSLFSYSICRFWFSSSISCCCCDIFFARRSIFSWNCLSRCSFSFYFMKAYFSCFILIFISSSWNLYIIEAFWRSACSIACFSFCSRSRSFCSFSCIFLSKSSSYCYFSSLSLFSFCSFFFFN